jgi:hypothetical protein
MFCIQKGSLGPALPFVSGAEHVDPRALTDEANTLKSVKQAKKALFKQGCITAELS